LDSKKTLKIQDLVHVTNEKMNEIAEEISSIKDSNMVEKEKNEKIRVFEQDFRQLLEDETKQVEEISQ